MTKALFFDIDGTLVSFKTHRIPQSAVEALSRAKELGHKIFISTGRPKCIINNLGQIEHLIDGFVTTNGALCYVGNQIVRQLMFTRQDIETIISDTLRNGYPAIVVNSDCLHVVNNSDVVDRIFVNELDIRNLDYDTPLEYILQKPISQITAFIDNVRERQLLQHLSQAIASRWHDAFIDITPMGADKGSGILAIADFLGIDHRNTVAFGDGGNDIPMLLAAHIGVAMGNAGQQTKKAANFVTSMLDDDGLATAMKALSII